MTKKHSHNTGFTLLEMAISMVIIALIIAASLKGGELIEAGRTRSLISEIGTYKIAVNSFYAKHQALPGDFNEATNYWTDTENGDGDGHMMFQNADEVFEGYRAWQHLSNEQMVSLPFTGTNETGAAILGTDIPKSRNNGGYFFAYGSFAGLDNDNILTLGVPMAANTGITPNEIKLGGLLTAQQAHDIDQKMDDADPLAGSAQAADADDRSTEDCINTTTQTYHVALDVKGCKMGFRLVTQ